MSSSVGDPRNLHNTFFVEKYYLNFDFFKYYRVLSLETKNNLKKDSTHLKIAWNRKRQGKNWKKRKKNNKLERFKQQKYFFLLLLFYMEKLVYIVILHLYYSFLAWTVIANAVSNKTSTPI